MSWPDEIVGTWRLPDPDEGYDEVLAAAMDLFGHAQPLAPGVEGSLIDHGSFVELRAIRAVEGTEGSGNVSRFLDTLPDDRMVYVPFVVSKRLVGMLQRRRFRQDLSVDHRSNHYMRRPT